MEAGDCFQNVTDQPATTTPRSSQSRRKTNMRVLGSNMTTRQLGRINILSFLNPRHWCQECPSTSSHPRPAVRTSLDSTHGFGKSWEERSVTPDDQFHWNDLGKVSSPFWSQSSRNSTSTHWFQAAAANKMMGQKNGHTSNHRCVWFTSLPVL